MCDDAPYLTPVTMAAIAVMVIATVLAHVLFESSVPTGVMTVLAGPYLVLTTVGWAWSERRGRTALAAVLVVTWAVTIALLWTSEQSLSLFLIPPLLMTVLHAGVAWGVVAIVAIAAIETVQNVGFELPASQVYLRSTGFVPGAILVVVFGVVLARERRAKRELAELAATRERNRIARDIHDSVGHYLTVVHVQLEAARAIVGTDPSAADECLGRAQALARDGLGELRRSVSMLRAPSERPFGARLEQLVGETRQAGLDASLAIEGTPRALRPAVEYALYRAVQEALTNVAKHARAKNARCTLRYVEGEVRLCIEDDGAGAGSGSSGDGFGLAGMRERLVAVGGTLEIRTAPGKGFTLDVRVPT